MKLKTWLRLKPWHLWICIMAILPLLVRSHYWIHIMILAGIYGILAASWDILVGYTGIMSFCPAAFYALGAYATGLLSLHFQLSPLLTMPVGVIFAGLSGLFLALTCVRLERHYLAIATLGFGMSVYLILANWVEVTHGVYGVFGIPSLPGIPPSWYAKELYFYIMLLLQAVVLLIIYRLMESDFGLRLRAIRDDELLAKSRGINTSAYKAAAFSISAAFSGLAGAYFAHFQTVITPDLADLSVTSLIVATAIIGGLGTTIGPVIVASLMWFATEYFRAFSPYLRVFLTGALLIITIKFFRSGIVPTLSKLYKKHFPKVHKKRYSPK